MGKDENTKKKILDALEDYREFDVAWQEEVSYCVTIKARNKEEAHQMFWD